MSVVRSGCEGVVPLPARLEPWQVASAARDPDAARRSGSSATARRSTSSSPAPLARNAAELRDARPTLGVELRIFFARKANKALALVDEASRCGLGIDVASERELRQVLDRGVPADDVVVTAAVKPRALLELCAASGATVAIDNDDELRAARRGRPGARRVPVALRLAPDLGPARTPTRFGLAPDELLGAARALLADAAAARR